jgi:hypothetical protein
VSPSYFATTLVDCKYCAIDKDAIARLDVDIRQQMPTANERASYYAAVWLYLTGVVDKARPLIDRALKMNPKHAMVSIVETIYSFVSTCSIYA